MPAVGQDHRLALCNNTEAYTTAVYYTSALSLHHYSFFGLCHACAGKVVAACRDPSSAVDLHTLAGMAGNENRLDVVRMDIEDQASLESAAEHVKNEHGVRLYLQE